MTSRSRGTGRRNAVRTGVVAVVAAAALVVSGTPALAGTVSGGYYLCSDWVMTTSKSAGNTWHKVHVGGQWQPSQYWYVQPSQPWRNGFWTFRYVDSWQIQSDILDTGYVGCDY